jgi:hypothetical protein
MKTYFMNVNTLRTNKKDMGLSFEIVNPTSDTKNVTCSLVCATKMTGSISDWIYYHLGYNLA